MLVDAARVEQFPGPGLRVCQDRRENQNRRSVCRPFAYSSPSLWADAYHCASFVPLQACQQFSGARQVRGCGTPEKTTWCGGVSFPGRRSAEHHIRVADTALSIFGSEIRYYGGRCLGGISWFLRSFVSSVFFLSFAGTAPAQSPTPAASASMCAVSSDEFLNARLAVWRQRLKLDDWKISIVPSHTDDLKPGTLGHIHWDAAKKIASIRVLDASDYRLACPDALNDMELTWCTNWSTWFFHRCRVPSRRTAAPRRYRQPDLKGPAGVGSAEQPARDPIDGLSAGLARQ